MVSKAPNYAEEEVFRLLRTWLVALQLVCWHISACNMKRHSGHECGLALCDDFFLKLKPNITEAA